MLLTGDKGTKSTVAENVIDSLKNNKKTITPEVIDEFKKYNKGDNAEDIAAYIWKNVQQMQQNNQPVAPKAPRGIMPQTDDAPNWVSDAPAL